MIKIIKFNEKYNNPIVLALGYFDSLHLGHIALIKRAEEVAVELKAENCVLTFSSDPSNIISKGKGVVLTAFERLDKLEKLGVNNVLMLDFNEKMRETSGEDFLKLLIANYDIRAFVCGFDYTFGKNALGNTESLQNFCNENEIKLYIEEKKSTGNEKIATTLIKYYLKNGLIEKANELLYYPYQICGKVIVGRKVGRTLGFPTINIIPPAEKFPLKIGVYRTHLYLDGEKYSCITNYGSCPTFGESSFTMETYIDGFSGNLYGKDICVYFDGFLREDVKFSSPEELKNQLTIDLETIRK